MAFKLVRVPELTLITGEPSVAAQPETCKQVQVGTQSVVEPVYADTLSVNEGDIITVDTYDPNVIGDTAVTYEVEEDDPLISDSERVLLGYQVVEKPIYETQCTPAVESSSGTPAQLIENTGPDWRSHARAQSILRGDGYYEFDLLGPAIAGFMVPPVTGSATLGAVLFGVFYGTSGSIAPVDRGVVGAEVSTGTGEIRVRVERQSGVYRILVGGTEVFSVSDSTAGDATLLAFLETDAAYVEDPESFEFTTTAVSQSATLPLSGGLTASSRSLSQDGRLRQRATAFTLVDGVALLAALGSLSLSGTAAPNVQRFYEAAGTLPLSSTVDTGNSFVAQTVLAKTEVLAGNARAGADLVVSKQAVEASGPVSAPVTQVTRANLAVNKMAFASYMLTGTVATAELTMPAQQYLISEGPYASAELVVPDQRLTAFSFAAELLNVNVTERIVARSGARGFAALLVTMDTGTITASSTTAITLVLSGDVTDTLTLSDDTDLVRTLQALLEAEIRFATSSVSPEKLDAQYITTLLSGAVSRSTGLEFDGFVYRNGRTFGLRKDGLYEITAGGAEEMDAEIDFGDSDYGTLRAKNMEAVFIGLTTDGRAFLKLTSDGKDKVYRIIQREPVMRAKIGRGLTAKTWGVGLQVMDVTSAELDGIEFVVGQPGRRWVK